MRQVVYSVAMSLDGYIAGPQGEYDWIPHDPDVDFTALFSRFDAMVLGRKTWQVVQQAGGGPGMSGIEAVVVSTSLSAAEVRDGKLFADPTSAIDYLRAKPGRDIWLFGGGVLFRSMLDAGLVDGVEVAVMPVLLGGGIPMLPAGGVQHRVKLQHHRVYPSTGTVLLSYSLDAARGTTGRTGSSTVSDEDGKVI
jgi:dihydrofolate reductase